MVSRKAFTELAQATADNAKQVATALEAIDGRCRALRGEVDVLSKLASEQFTVKAERDQLARKVTHLEAELAEYRALTTTVLEALECLAQRFGARPPREQGQDLDGFVQGILKIKPSGA